MKGQGDYENDKDLADMIQMLDSPLFKQLLTVQESLQELGEKMQVNNDIQPEDFEFSPTGELTWVQEGMSDLYLHIKRFNPFHANGLFLYPPKTSQSHRFFDNFRGYKRRQVVWNLLKSIEFSSLNHPRGLAKTFSNISDGQKLLTIFGKKLCPGYYMALNMLLHSKLIKITYQKAPARNTMKTF